MAEGTTQTNIDDGWSVRVAEMMQITTIFGTVRVIYNNEGGMVAFLRFKSGCGCRCVMKTSALSGGAADADSCSTMTPRPALEDGDVVPGRPDDGRRTQFWPFYDRPQNPTTCPPTRSAQGRLLPNAFLLFCLFRCPDDDCQPQLLHCVAHSLRRGLAIFF